MRGFLDIADPTDPHAHPASSTTILFTAAPQFVLKSGNVIPTTWFFFLKIALAALTSVARLTGCHQAKRKVTGLIPSQGTCPGCGFGLLDGVRVRGNRSMFSSPRCFSPFLPPSLPLKINK